MYVTTLRQLLDTMATVKADPKARIKTGMWDRPYWTASDFRTWFDKCLNAKINRGDARESWRKMSDEYQQYLANDARRVNEYYRQRIRNSGCSGLLRTKEMQRRYPHVNCQEWREW